MQIMPAVEILVLLLQFTEGDFEKAFVVAGFSVFGLAITEFFHFGTGVMYTY
jgi:hypothetical protein